MADPLRPFLALAAHDVAALADRLQVPEAHLWRLRRHLLQGWDPASGAPPMRRGQALPADLLERLAGEIRWLSCSVETERVAGDGAHKLLLRLADGERVEAVRLPGSRRGSACLSSQVGCAMACRFCASGLDGVVRNLAGHELLEQVALLRRTGPVRRLVLMGSGEPSRNLRALAEALPVLRDEAEIGPSHVLVSTVGPAAAIERLGALGLPFTLALSLHALDPALRADLVPTQVAVEPLDLLAAADAYAARTGRAYQVEWVLLGGLNDRDEDAHVLAAALAGRRAHLSLIPWNSVPGQAFRAPAPGRAEAFLRVLRSADVSAVLRRTVGAAADAACGQLRRAVATPGSSSRVATPGAAPLPPPRAV